MTVFLKPDECAPNVLPDPSFSDVRTGIVIHTARATENIAMKKAPADLNFSETIARAESDARGKALLTLADIGRVSSIGRGKVEKA